VCPWRSGGLPAAGELAAAAFKNWTCTNAIFAGPVYFKGK
jgi:hypothetical protein